MNQLGRPVAFLSVLLLLAACNESKKNQGPEYCGDVKTVTSDIHGGTAYWDPAIVPLTENQAKAVGFLNIGGYAGCTGTLVAPHTVLTAAHCVTPLPPYVQFFVGDDIAAPEGVYNALSYEANPAYGGGYVDYDVAVVTLSENPMDDGVVPIPVHLEPPRVLTGEMVQAVGFGMTYTDDHSNRRKWWTDMFVRETWSRIYVVYGPHDNGTCQGDSGGPLLWNDPTDGVMVYGPLSSGDSSGCDGSGNSYYPRTDAGSNATFIESKLPVDPCDGETLAGRCEGTEVAIYCEDNVLHHDECGEWAACMLDAEGHSRCVVTDPCQGETWEGRCDDDGHAVWCEDEIVLTHPCPDFGYSCRLNDESLYRCMPPGPCDAEGLDFHGACTADGHARWCEDGEVKDRDCILCEQICDWAGDQLGWYCIDPPE